MSEIQKLHQALASKEVSCEALVREKIGQIKESKLNSSNFILEEYALEKAKAVDLKIQAGESIGLLEGIPFGLKDVYMLQGQPASASSDFQPN